MSIPTFDGDAVGVRVTVGDHGWREYPVAQSSNFIGRDPAETLICFPDHLTAISRVHASIRWDPSSGTYRLRDEGSMNGTFDAAGRRVPPGEEIEVPRGGEFYLATREYTLRTL